ncbi:hypothetical protein SLT67_04625 [Paenibacillus illinoisensis]|uniref:hypothetical protein n=1 Tax=Paenibacillus illinoisensis TaxID=59845 RepID=UPI003CF14A7D
MIKDLKLAELKNYPVCLTLIDGTKNKGVINVLVEQQLVKIKSEISTEWIPMDQIKHCSLLIPISFERQIL